MKKLMIMVGVAAVAIASNAAAVTWAAKNIYTPVATDAKKSQSGIVMTAGDKMPTTASMAIQLFWVDSKGVDQLIGNYSLTAAGVVGKQNLATSMSDALYLAMVDNQGSTWKPEYHVTATYTTAAGVYSYSGFATASTPIGNLSAGANVAATADFTNGSWNYTAAPEPTSGLLLLLGMAGIALKRKRA